MLETVPPVADLTYLDKRVVCRLRDSNIVILLGLVKKDIRVLRELVNISHPGVTDQPITASLVRVTPKLVEYRQVMKEGAGGTFDPAQK